MLRLQTAPSRLHIACLARGQEAIPLSGTISFDREIDLRGGSAADAVAITGTLEHPEVKAVSEEVEN